MKNPDGAIPYRVGIKRCFTASWFVHIDVLHPVTWKSGKKQKPDFLFLVAGIPLHFILRDRQDPDFRRDFAPTGRGSTYMATRCPVTANKKNPHQNGEDFFVSSGDRTWTCNLRVMSPTSYQLLHPAMYILIQVAAKSLTTKPDV